MSAVELSVVIPCLNVADTLWQQLDALTSQDATFDWEVIVVDNGSHDATLELARSYGDRLDISIVEEQERGRQFACNTGARAARSQHLAFIDGDDLVAPSFVRAMRRALDSYDIAAGQHENLPIDDSLGHGTRLSGGLIDGFGFLPFASGACTGIRRSTFMAVSGYHPAANYCEDADLSWRVQLAGYSIGSAPDAIVRYRQRSSLRSMFRQHRNFGQARVWLYREFKEAGMPRRSRSEVLLDWVRIFRAVPFLRDPDVRIRWTRRLGRNIGFVRGSIVERQLFL